MKGRARTAHIPFVTMAVKTETYVEIGRTKSPVLIRGDQCYDIIYNYNIPPDNEVKWVSVLV